MDEKEIEAMMVRVVGDASSYKKMCTEATAETAKLASTVEKHTEHIKKVGEHIQGYGETLVRNLASIGIAVEAWHTIEMAENVEKTMRRLDVLMESHGENIERTRKEYKEFAAQMFNVTMASKGEIMSLIQQAEMFGLTGDKAKKAAHDALALAATTPNMAPQSLIRLLATMEETGNKQRLAFMLGLRGMHDQDKIAEKINERISNGMKILAGDMETVEGQTQKMRQSFGYLSLEVGNTFLPVMNFLVGTLKDVVDWINSLNTHTKALIVGVIIAAAAVQPLTGAWRALVWVFTPAITALVAIYNAMIAASVAIITRLIPAFLSLQYVTLGGTVAAITSATVAIVKFAATAALIGGMVAIIPAVAYGFVAIVKEIKGYRTEMEALKKAQEEVLALQDALTKQRFEKTERDVAKIMNAGGREAQIKAGEAEIAKREKQIERLEHDLEVLKKSAEEAGNIWKMDIFEVTMGSVKEETALAAVATATRNVAEARAGLARIKTVTAEIGHAKPEDIEHARQLNEKMKEEIELFGLSGHEREIMKLRMKGVLDADLAAAKAKAATLALLKEESEAFDKAAKEREHMEKLVGDMEDSLMLENYLLANNRMEYEKFYKMLDEGVDASVVEALEDLYDLNKVMKEGIETTKKFQDPVEKLDDEYRKLVQQLNAGAITSEIFQNAAQDLQDQFDEITNSVKKTREEIQKLDGVLYGSAEAKFRIQAFHDLDLGGPKKGKAVDWAKTIQDIGLDTKGRRKEGGAPPEIEEPKEFVAIEEMIDGVVAKGAEDTSIFKDMLKALEKIADAPRPGVGGVIEAIVAVGAGLEGL